MPDRDIVREILAHVRERESVAIDTSVALDGDHATDEEIIAYEDGSLDGPAADRLWAHVNRCNLCWGRLDALMRLAPEWETEEGAKGLTVLRERVMARLGDIEARISQPAEEIQLSLGLLNDHLTFLLSTGLAPKAQDRIRGGIQDLALFNSEFGLSSGVAAGTMQSNSDAPNEDRLNAEIPDLLSNGQPNPIKGMNTLILRRLTENEWDIVPGGDNAELLNNRDNAEELIAAWFYTLESLIERERG